MQFRKNEMENEDSKTIVDFSEPETGEANLAENLYHNEQAWLKIPCDQNRPEFSRMWGRGRADGLSARACNSLWYTVIKKS